MMVTTTIFDEVLQGIALVKEGKHPSARSLRELAEKSGVPKGTLNKIAQGVSSNPRIKTLLKLQQFLREGEK